MPAKRHIAVPRCVYSRIRMSFAAVAGSVIEKLVVVAVPPSAFAMKRDCHIGLLDVLPIHATQDAADVRLNNAE